MKPVVYSCSGCSDAGQLSNELATQLNYHKYAKMSCIAGIGGSVPSIVKTAKQASEIIAIDGCQLHCVKSTLSQKGIPITKHIDLSTLGIKKNKTTDEDFVRVWNDVLIPMFEVNNE